MRIPQIQLKLVHVVSSAGTLIVAGLVALLIWSYGCQGNGDHRTEDTGRAIPAAEERAAPQRELRSAPVAPFDARQQPLVLQQPRERSPARPMVRPVRAIWVARFHYRYENDVRVIIRNIAAMGFNTVLWQVRGEATVTYPSTIEPWPAEFEFKDPGFDPLAVAVEEAHANNLRIEAWFNVLPGWKGEKPPESPNQLYNTRPQWFLYDASGKRQPLGDFYVLVNPALPEVRQYIASVARELLDRYDVDGLHLDYVRYAWDLERGARKRYMRDPRTLELYKRETGRKPDDDAKRWDEWRIAALTQLVSDIRATVRTARPGATLTAAVRPDPNDARNNYFQDSAGWLKRGLLDAAFPMVYTEKMKVFEKNVASYRQVGRGVIVPGIGAYLQQSVETTRSQLDRCRAWGGDFAIYSYDSLLPSHVDRTPKKPGPAEQSLRIKRREVLGGFLSSME